MIGTQAEVTYLDYSDVPLINQDIEFPEPEAVGRLRATVKAADASGCSRLSIISVIQDT